ncbi:MAG: GDSL-type esterase/lipase family protein [Clostridia bacterium]|nr:GDSL-type esterase/lipase family protein [Clostridia bacterium]
MKIKVKKIKVKKIINLLLAATMTVSCFGQAVIVSAETEETTETANYMLYDAEFNSIDDLQSLRIYFPNNNTELKVPDETCIHDGVFEVSSDSGFRYKRLAVLPNIENIENKNIHLETRFKYTKINDTGAMPSDFIDIGGGDNKSWFVGIKYSNGLTFGGDNGKQIETKCTLSPDQWYTIKVKFDFKKYTFKLELKDDENNILYNEDAEGTTVYNKRPSSVTRLLMGHILGNAESTKQYFDYIRIWDNDLIPSSVTATYSDGQELNGAKNLDFTFDATVNFSQAVTAKDLEKATVTGGNVTVKSLSEDRKTAVLTLSGLPEYSSCTLDIPSIGGNDAVSFTFSTKMSKEYIYRSEFNGYDDNADTWYKLAGNGTETSIADKPSLIQNGNMFLGYGTVAYSRFLAKFPQAADLSGKENVYLQTKFKYSKGNNGGLYTKLLELAPLTASVLYRADEGVVVGAASNGEGGTAMGYTFDTDQWYTLTVKLNYKSHTYCVIIDDGSGNIKQSPIVRFTDNRTTNTLEKIYMFGVGLTNTNGTDTTHYVDYLRVWDNDAGNADVVYTTSGSEYTLKDSMIVPVNAEIKLTAKNDVQSTAGIVINDENGNAVDSDVTADGKVVTISPKADLAYDTNYSVVIPAEIVNNDNDQVVEFKTTFDATSSYTKPNIFANKTGLKTVFLGGSITEMRGWSAVVENYIKEKFPDSTFINSGVGGTGSQYGWMRLYNDVMKFDPDVVFVEFAVNDSTVSTTNQYMESIVRNLNKLPNPPVIIFTELPVNDLSNNDYALTEHKKLAKAYGIPLINVRDYVKSLYNSNSDFASEWDANIYFSSNDRTHPSQAGSALYGTYATDLMEHNTNKYFVKPKSNAEVSPLTDYKDFVYYYEAYIQKLNKDNANLDIAFNGTEMIVEYQLLHDVNGNKGGTFEIYVDNTKVQTVNTYLENTNTYYDGFKKQISVTGLSEGAHTAKIVRVDNNDDTEIISILGAFFKKTNGTTFTDLVFDTNSFTAGTPVTAHTIYTSGEENRNVIFALGLYDVNGKLTGAVTVNTQLSDTVIGKKIDATITPKIGDKTLKAFCWDASTLNPFVVSQFINAAE